MQDLTTKFSSLQMISTDDEFICPVYDTDLDMLCLDCPSTPELQEKNQISSLDLMADFGSDILLDELLQFSDNSIDEISTSSSYDSVPSDTSDLECQEFSGDAAIFAPDPAPNMEPMMMVRNSDTYEQPISYKKLRMMRRITIEQAFVGYFAEKGQLSAVPIVFDKNDAEQIASEILARRVKIGRAGRKLKYDKPVRNRSQYMKVHGALMKAKWTRVISSDAFLTQYLYFKSL
jgi:hypothetical protein